MKLDCEHETDGLLLHERYSMDLITNQTLAPTPFCDTLQYRRTFITALVWSFCCSITLIGLSRYFSDKTGS